MKDKEIKVTSSKKKPPVKILRGEEDGTGRLAMEDMDTADFKTKVYVDPATGQTKSRKVRAHRLEFKNSKAGGKPAISQEERTMTKKTFSEFKEEFGLDEAKFAKGGIPSAPNTGNKDDGYTKRQRQRAAKKRAEELTKQRRQRAMGEEYDLEDFSLDESKTTLSGSPSRGSYGVIHRQSGKEIGIIQRQPGEKEEYTAMHTATPVAKSEIGTFKSKEEAHKFIRDAHARALKNNTISDKWKKSKPIQSRNLRFESFEQYDLEDFSLEEIEDFMMSEDFEQLDELSKATLVSYRDKANKQIDRGLMRSRDIRGDKTAMKRMRNIGKAQKRLANEELDLDEAKWPSNLGVISGHKTGDVTKTAHDVTKTAKGTRYTRRFGPDDMAIHVTPTEKKGRGRPTTDPDKIAAKKYGGSQALQDLMIKHRWGKVKEAVDLLADLDEETFESLVEQLGFNGAVEFVMEQQSSYTKSAPPKPVKGKPERPPKDVKGKPEKAPSGMVNKYSEQLELDLDEEQLLEELPGTENMHPMAKNLVKHIKPQHLLKYGDALMSHRGTYRDSAEILSAAQKAGHLKD